jgi:hypothetical protein
MANIWNKEATTTTFSGPSVNAYMSRRIPLEKLRVAQLIKKFLALCGIRRFITMFTRARHRSIS